MSAWSSYFFFKKKIRIQKIVYDQNILKLCGEIGSYAKNVFKIIL